MASNRKSTLLKVGERLFAEHGYRDVSIKDITASSGLGMGSFYTYFPSKEVFYSEILDSLEERGLKEVEKHVNRFRSPLFRLKALLRYTILSLRSTVILRGIYAREKRYLYPGAEDRRHQSTSLFARVEELLREILAEGTRKGVFRTSLFKDPTALLIAIFSAVSLNGSSSPDMADDMMMLVERGLKRWLRFRRQERVDMRTRRPIP
ncbi:MAG TPA: TetR/AcrR family transcriptional regulator [Spirochaetia bacterium]|nr:TetR/AcrR family transcriptional regulator [Spirochaetia bacterium]